MKKHSFVLFIFVTSLVSSLWAGEKTDGTVMRSVSTMGTVKVLIPADSARIVSRVECEAKTLEESNAALERALGNLRDELSRLGIPLKALTINTRFSNRTWLTYRSVPNGYESGVIIGIQLNDMKKFDELLIYMGTREEYNIWSRNLESSKEGAERKAAIAAALRAARMKAEILAKEGNLKIGQLYKVSEENTDDTWYGNHASNMAVNSTSHGRGDDGDRGDGSHKIRIYVRVNATFELIK